MNMSSGGIAGGTMGTIITVLVTNLLLAIGIQILQTPFTDVVTKEYEKDCTVASLVVTCTLSPPSFYRTVNADGVVATGDPRNVLPGFSFSQTGGSGAESSIALNTAGTSFTITYGSGTISKAAVTYLGADNENDLRALWLALPMIAIVGGVTGLFAMASSVQLQGSGTGRIMSGIVALIVGASLVTVQNQFVSSAQQKYNATPEFIGLDAIWILLELSFVFIILAIAFGLVSGNSVFGYAKEKIGKREKKRSKRGFAM